MKKALFLFAILSIIPFHSTFAQSDDIPKNKRAIKAAVGYGISVPYDDNADFYGSGFYAQAEYVYTVKEWFDIRPYAGFIFANSNEDTQNSRQEVLTADINAFLLGGKVRLKAPIPWVAPFVEIGAGMSIGEFETITETTRRIKESGMIFHIPVSLGLVLGPKQNFEIAFTYYYHNKINQFAGAAAFGVTFPLN